MTGMCRRRAGGPEHKQVSNVNELSEKNKYIMGGALAVLVIIALIIKLGGSAAAKLAEQMLVKQNVVAGSLTYEKINAGFAGDVEIRNIVWKSPDGKVKMELPLATASVNFFDALRQGGGISSVTNIVFNRPQFYGTYIEGQGLDLLNLLKLAGNGPDQVTKSASGFPEEPTRFRGLIEVKEGALNLDSNGKKVTLSKINSQMAFKQYPILRASAIASKESCDLVLNMTYENGSAQVTGEAKNAAAADLLAMYPDLKHIKVDGGVVPTIKIMASKDKDGWHINLDGKPRNMTGDFFGMKFTDGQGSFTADRDVATIEELQASVEGMPVTVRGIIKSGRATPLPPGFDLEFKGNQFKTYAMSKGMYLDDAAVSLSGKLTGTAVEPKLEGVFTSEYIYAAPLKLTNVHGGFVWDAGKLTLKHAVARGAGADISLSGFLMIPAKDFTFDLSGNNLDAAQITDNRVTGLLHIRAQISGKNLTDSATGTGQFIMRKGIFYYTEGGLRREEIRYLQGEIAIKDGAFGTRAAEMKLGRNKYNISVITTEKEAAEIRIGEKAASSLF